MTMEGGNINDVSAELIMRLVTATERSADAQEALITLAKEEREAVETSDKLPGLPICPHCGTFNPSIRNEGGTGLLAEFVLFAQCDNCQKMFIAEPQGWNMYKDKSEYEGREEDDIST